MNMEKKILEEILRIKKLMGNNLIPNDFLIEQGYTEKSNMPLAYRQDYNPTPAVLSPQTNLRLNPVSPTTQTTKQGFIVDPCGVPEVPSQKFLDGNTIPRNSVDYKQEVTTIPTLFNDIQDVMECWDFKLFDSTSNAANCMYLGDRTMYLDEVNGYYFFADDSQQVRIYLPKDEFFKSLAGKVKSIVAYKTCRDACSSKNSQPALENVYTLMYNLQDPKKAMLTSVMTPEGPIFQASEDISRGWQIDYSAVKDVGYFNIGNVVTNDTVTPSNISELSLANYGKEFARSQFDIWYDSFGGTIISIGIAVAASVFSEGTLAPIMLQWIASQGARTLGVFLIKQTAEYVIAIPEIVYLLERGENSQAAFIFLLAHIPVVENKWIQPMLKIDKDIVYGQTVELLNRYRNGTFKTPADVKNFMKKLPEEIRKKMETVFKITADELVSNPNLFKKNFAREIQYIVNKASKGELDKVERAFQRVQTKYAYKIPKTSQKLLKGVKIFGIIMFPAMGINYGLTEIIEESPIAKDPYKLGKITQALEFLPKLLEAGEQNILKAKQENFKAKINTAFQNQDYPLLVDGVSGLLKILEDTDKIMDGKIKMTSSAKIEFESNKGDVTSEFVSILLGFIVKRIAKEKLESYKKGQAGYSAFQKEVEKILNTYVYDQNLYTSFCVDETLLGNVPKTKQESCSFRDWVIKTHSDFQFPAKQPDGSVLQLKLTSCRTWESLTTKFPDDFYLKECGFKYAWTDYGDDYEKTLKVNPQKTKDRLPPKK